MPAEHQMGVSRTSRLLVLLTTMTAMLLMLAGPASAQLVQLAPGPLTDDVEVIRSPSTVRAALDELVDETGVMLTAVLVSSFDGLDPVEWADDVAISNGFGPRDVLLAIAVDDRIYAPLNVDAGFELSDAELDRIAADHTEPALRADDWDGAVTATAAALCAALGGDCTAAAGTAGGTSGGTTPASGGGPGLLLWIVIGAVIGLIVVLVLRSRRSGGGQAAAPAPGGDELAAADLATLRTRTGAALVALDDRVRETDQEAAFAELEFGAEPVAEVRRAVAAAQTVLTEAFATSQQLDAAADAASTREAYQSLVRQLESTDAELEDQVAAFAALRDQRSRIPETRTELGTRLEQIRRDAPALPGVLARLSEDYAPVALTSIADNVDQVTARLELAEDALAQADTATEAGDDNAAVLALRDAEAALGQAEQLAAAVHAARAELESADRSLDAALAQLGADLAELDGSAAARGELAGPIGAARVAFEQTSTARASGDLDPVAAMARIAEVSVPLEQALQHEQQLATTFDGLDRAAAARIASVHGYLTTRRGAIGPEPRARLAEADRTLRQAQQLRDSDLPRAVALAQQAQQLAEQAGRLAEREVRSYRPAAAPPARSMSTGRALGTGAVAGAAVGGLAASSRRRQPTSGGARGTTARTTGRSTGGTTRSTGGTRSSGTTRSTGGTRRGSTGGGSRGGGSTRRGGGGGRF